VRCAVKVQGEYLGFYIVNIEWGNNLYAEYELEKDKFMAQVRAEEIHNADYKKIAREIMSDTDFEYYKKNRNSLKLFIEQKKPNLTIGENNLIAEQIKIFLQNPETNQGDDS
jgi:hypothetical protein